MVVEHPLSSTSFVPAQARRADRPLSQARERGDAAAHVRSNEGPADRRLRVETPLELGDCPANQRQEGRGVPGAARRRRHARRRLFRWSRRRFGFIGDVPRRGDAPAGRVLLEAPDRCGRPRRRGLDPMLATGSPPAAAVDAVKEAGARRWPDRRSSPRPRGSSTSTSDRPDVQIVCAAVDRGLDTCGASSCRVLATRATVSTVRSARSARHFARL